jgi:four helix bundle protein
VIGDFHPFGENCSLMDCTPDILRSRTKQFALRIIRLIRALPNSSEARVIGQQVLRSGTSVAANYRAACRGRSRPDFISKLGIVLEEADETVFWLELLAEAGIIAPRRIQQLLEEANELVKIFSAACNTAKQRKQKPGQAVQIANHQSQIKNS